MKKILAFGLFATLLSGSLMASAQAFWPGESHHDRWRAHERYERSGFFRDQDRDGGHRRHHFNHERWERREHHGW